MGWQSRFEAVGNRKRLLFVGNSFAARHEGLRDPARGAPRDSSKVRIMSNITSCPIGMRNAREATSCHKRETDSPSVCDLHLSH